MPNELTEQGLPVPPAPSREGWRAIGTLAAGFAIGTVLRGAPESVGKSVLAVVDPIGTLWVNAIRMCVIPLVTALLVTGVTKSSSTSHVAKLGARALVAFVLSLAGVVTLTGFLAPLMYSGVSVDPAAAEQLRASVANSMSVAPEIPGFVAWITSLVPVNPVKAAVEGQMLPLIIFTLFFSLALRFVDEAPRRAVVAFFAGIAEAMMTLVRWVLGLAPLGIAALAIALGLRLGLGAAGVVGVYLGTHIGILLLAMLGMYALAIFVGGIGPAAFARAALPAQVVAASTRSSLAALPAMFDAAARWGVPRETASFAIPFAVSIFRPNVAVTWIVGGLFLGKLYGVEVPASAIVTLGIAALALSFSVPGIPSGSLFIIAPVLPQVGLPAEGVGILIALDALPDVFKTSLNVTGHLASTLVVSRADRIALPPHHAAPDSPSPEKIT